ncbi:MAG: DinB family protein [Candidatus Hydrogenedentes bacterium]|nr:DinB family protein [Candidatus Hydrogenedentota bacterium]
MSRSKMEVYDVLFQSAFVATSNAAENVAPDSRMRQPKGEKAHPLWLVGHLAFANDSILCGILFGGKRVAPREFTKLFGPHFIGAEPVTADPAKYPPWDEVVAVYKNVSENSLALLAQQSDVDLQGGAKGKVPVGTESMFETYIGTLNMMLLHDSYHRGQLGMLSSE